MTVFPRGSEIIDKFLEVIDKNDFFSLRTNEGGVVLHFDYNGQKYAAYFKCVSYAGKPYPLNTTRAQLPQRPEFESIGKDERFLFLGYDVDNDLFVCWDPIKAKSRLNKKNYVSFFCRKNIQDSVQEGNVVESRLTNGDVYVLFKRCDTSRFFEMIEIHFPQLEREARLLQMKELALCKDYLSNQEDEVKINNFDSDEEDNVSNAEPIGLLSDICSDPIIKAFVDQLLEQNKSTLYIISKCCNTFSTNYNAMLFKEWADIVNKYIDSL